MMFYGKLTDIVLYERKSLTQQTRGYIHQSPLQHGCVTLSASAEKSSFSQ